MFSRSFVVFAAVSLLAISAFTSPTLAATKISVVEDGEGGGPMSLKLEPSTVKAGAATFDVVNHATTEMHEMIVVKLKSSDQAIPLNTAKHRIDEAKLKSLGEVSDLKAGAAGELKLDLKAGTYLVFCNIKGHYEAGMEARLTVTP